MPVILLITLLATVIFLITLENASGLSVGASEAESTEATYVAEAGIQHAIWQARASDCGTYTNLTDHPFGDHSYSVLVAPTEGSPVNLQSTSALASGATATMQALSVPVYSATATSSLTLQPGPEGKDAYVWHGGHSHTNFGASPIFDIRERQNALIQFDLSELPPGAIITDARLGLYLEDGRDFTDGVFDLHRLTRDWVEGTFDDDEPPPGGGVTYDEYDGSNAWTTEGGDYDSAIIDSIVIPALNLGWKEWVVTDQIQAWHDGQANYGFLLRHDKEAGGDADVDFTSSDGIAANAPRLTITYAGCECGKECVSAEVEYCEADFEAIVKSFEFDWMPGTNELTGVDFLPEGVIVNGVTIPEGGGWIMIDRGEKDFFVTDSLGTTLTSFPSAVSDPRGLAYIDGGAWLDHLAVTDWKDHVIYLLDLDGAIQGSITTEFIAEEPFGISYIGATDSHIYEDHIAFTSQKNGGGEVYIINQAGVLVKTIDVDDFAPKPQGVAHLAGADKLMVVDLDFIVSIIDFDGVVLNQYNVDAWGMSEMRGTTIHPDTCEHVILDKDIKLVAGLSPFEGSEAAAPGVLMVVANASNLTTQEEAKKTLIESWGYTTSVLSDQSSGSVYDAAVAVNDVVYVGEDVASSSVGTKLVDAPIGVITEEANLSDEFGLSSTISWGNGSMLDIDDNSHYITLPFATGPLQILDNASSLADLSGTPAPGLEVLGSTGAGPLLATLEASAEMIDSSAAAGRRAYLPWGGNDFDLANLTADGETIFKRSLEWGVQPPLRCDADYAANILVSDFPWMPNTADIQGIDYLPAGLVVNSVSVPTGGGWIMSDKNKDRLFVTDLAGNTLTDFLIVPPDSQGVALIDAGLWINHFAVIDTGQKRFYYLDLNGSLVWSYSLDGVIDNPFGLGFIGSTDSATYDNHLAISSDKNPSGGGTATIYIVDQLGGVAKTIDIETHAPTPLGVTHVNGADKLIVADKTGVVSVIDFDGNLLHQYSAAIFGLTEVNEIAINPMTCDHVFVQKNEFENIASVNRDNGDGSPQYFEMFMPWSVVSPDTWESANLEIYGVPPNAVVEVAVLNADGNELWGGVRASGSTLQRRLQLHEKNGGVEVMVMHVQADANGLIELYSDKEDKITFVILGYWIETKYVENWQTFKAGGSNSWRDHSLNSYGVGSNDVAEVLVVNNDGFDKRKVGVRSNGSSLPRQIELHEAKDGGDEAMSMLAAAGSDGGATVEVYAQVDADIDFYLLGHWSTPPGTYASAFENLGSAAVKNIWEDADLSSEGVPANAVVHILAANNETGGGAKLGVREKGSFMVRLLDLHKAEYGGLDFPSLQVDVASMHVNADANSVIEWYDEDVDKSHFFYLLGWWVLTP